jgi:hypothetical protein
MNILIEMLKKLQNGTELMKFRFLHASRRQKQEIKNYQRWISKANG